MSLIYAPVRRPVLVRPVYSRPALERPPIDDAAPRLIVPSAQIDQRIARQILPVALLLGGRRGPQGDTGPAGTAGSTGADLGRRIECTVQPSSLSGSTLRHPAGPSTIAAASSAAWRVKAPAGSTWRVALATDGTLPSGETLSLSIFQATTVDGTYATIVGSLLSLTDASGADPDSSGPIVQPSDSAVRWLTLGIAYSSVTSWNKSIHASLERVT